MLRRNGNFSEKLFGNFFAKMNSAKESDDDAEFRENKKYATNFSKYCKLSIFLQPECVKMRNFRKKKNYQL